MEERGADLEEIGTDLEEIGADLEEMSADLGIKKKFKKNLDEAKNKN